jgi:hypothetical protein
MITAILSLLGGLGIPSIILGILSKFGFSWLSSGFIAPIAKACAGLVDLALMVLRWVLEKVISGLDHIVKSPTAVATVILMMWGSYAYGIHKAPTEGAKTRVEQPRQSSRARRTHTRTTSAPKRNPAQAEPRYVWDLGPLNWLLHAK